MKIRWNETFSVVTRCNCTDIIVGVFNTFDEAFNFVKDNWVEGEGMIVQIRATDTDDMLCEFTDEPQKEKVPSMQEMWDLWTNDIVVWGL